MNLCWFYRRAVVWTAESDHPLPQWLERHLGRCGACRQVQDGQAALIAGLRREARTAAVEMPPFLHGKIMRSCETCGTAEASWGENWRAGLGRWWRSALLPAAVVLMISGYALWQFGPNPSLPEQMAAEAPGEVIQPIGPAQGVPLLVWAERIDQPLQDELQSVLSDARSALVALTDNFLPNIAVEGGENPLDPRSH